MAHGRPWYKRNGADLVMATLSFPSSDHKWAYSAIIDILNERDRPIADDPGFICGFTGLSKRRWTPVRQWLLDHGYLQLTPDGGLTNARFERERAERLQEREAAVEHGREGGRKSAAKRAAGQGELEFISGLSRDKRPIISGKTEDNSGERTADTPKNNDLAQPPPQASRGRERASEAREESIQTNDHKDSLGCAPESPSARSLGPNPDLVALLDLVSDASGFHPVEPKAIANALDLVKAWRDSGIDFDNVVLPAIRDLIAKSDDPTSSLRRFDKRIRHDAAKHRGAKANGSAPPARPAAPILDPTGEDPVFRPIREAILAHLGPQLYPLLMNSVVFEEATIRDERVVRVHGMDHLIENVVHGRNTAVIKGIVREHGFADLWKGSDRWKGPG